MKIVWTDEARKLVTERTADDVKARKPPTSEAAWARLRAVPQFKTSVDVPGVAPRMGTALEMLARAEPPTSVDVDAFAVLFVLLLSANDAVLDLASALAGLPRALEVIIRAHSLKDVWDKQVRSVVAGADQRRFYNDPLLRRALLRADAATYDACLAVASTAWPAATIGLRLAIAHRFPNERSWGREVARAWLDAGLARPPVGILFANLDDADLAAKIFAQRVSSSSMIDLVAWLGEDAFPIVLDALRAPRDVHELKHAAAAASLFESEEVASLFAATLSKVQARSHAVLYFQRFPALGRAALEPLSKGKSRVATMAQEILEQINRAGDASADRVSSDAAEEATPAELPPILVNPPWRAKKKPSRKPIVLKSIAMLTQTERVDLAPDASLASFKTIPVMTADEVREYVAHARAGKHHPTGLSRGRLPDDIALMLFNEGSSNAYAGPHQLQRFGVRGLPGFILHLERYWPEFDCPRAVLLAVDSPRIALTVARQVDRKAGDDAWDWIVKHSRAAIVGLIPTAVGEAGEARRTSESVLRRLNAKGQKTEILAIAGEHGAEVLRSVEEILAWDARFDCPKAAPKMPLIWKPEGFTRPRLKSGKELPLDAVRALGEMLAFSPVDPPYPGIAEVRAMCDPRSLAELAWDTAQAWDMAGAKNATQWMLYSLVHFADDEVTRRTTPAIKDRRILDVLRWIGTDAAAMEIATIAARATVTASAYVASTQYAEQLFADVARQKGMSKDELDDRIAPTAQLDERGRTTLDFGERRFEVTFTSRLEPVAIDAEGQRFTTFPAKRKTDDAAKVKTAMIRWSELREDVTTIAMRRIASLERAMVSQRTWLLDQFRRVWVDSPLFLHIAQAVVWSTNGLTFRVAEDRSFVNERDEPLVVPEGAEVHVADALVMSSETRARWATLFADYELIQPLSQLDRRIEETST